MKKIFNKLTMVLPLSLLLMTVVSSCNKELPAAKPIWVDPQLGTTIADVLNTDASFSILKAAVTKAGLMDAVASRTTTFTVFAPNDAAFIASGIPLAAINALPAATVASIVQYHIIPGQKITSSAIPTTFPNVQMPTAFIFPAPNTNPLVRFNTFPSKRGSSVWVNNIPVTAADINVANGVIHAVAAVVAPPSTTLWQAINADVSLTYLVAAINAADAGGAAGSRFQDYLSIPFASFTLMAPNDQAFKNLLTFLMPPGTPISTGLFGLLPKTTLQGIVAYHVLGSRAFSTNLPTVATGVPTLLSSSLPGAPLLTFDAAQGAKGAKNPSYSKILTKDKHSFNGVYHIIDQVLLPQ
jgi:uncharacterized surface protein with fasciclin (FAS1) repeats